MQALVRAVASLFQTRGLHGKREIWARYAVWLLLGLEFLLASDIIRTANRPDVDGHRPARRSRRPSARF